MGMEKSEKEGYATGSKSRGAGGVSGGKKHIEMVRTIMMRAMGWVLKTGLYPVDEVGLPCC
eukprot:766697-Hanusia_phi.AAC.2